MFHDAKVVTENPRKCCMLITKLLHLVTQGDELSSNEVTEVFFGVTKLFQSNDMNLRRCVASRPLLSLCARAISLSLNRVRRARRRLSAAWCTSSSRRSPSTATPTTSSS